MTGIFCMTVKMTGIFQHKRREYWLNLQEADIERDEPNNHKFMMCYTPIEYILYGGITHHEPVSPTQLAIYMGTYMGPISAAHMGPRWGVQPGSTWVPYRLPHKHAIWVPHGQPLYSIQVPQWQPRYFHFGQILHFLARSICIYFNFKFAGLSINNHLSETSDTNMRNSLSWNVTAGA